jgi:hypothetical protein
MTRLPRATATASHSAFAPRRWSRIARGVFVVLTLLAMSLLVACGSSGARKKQTAIDEYEVAIRWSEFDRAEMFLDPLYLQEHPLTDLERERYKLFQVAGYEVKRTTALEDGGVEQTVEIRVVNKLTQTERIVVDLQRWRFDEAGKRWWLMSGLPSFGKE